MKKYFLCIMLMVSLVGCYDRVTLLQGPAGTNGTNGTDGASALSPGVLCNVHDLSSWSNETSLPQALANNAPKGSFVLANFSVPDSQAANGFPGMPASLQDTVGYEGYALDCEGYLNVPTTGLYTFSLLSDDGSYLAVEDNSVVQNQGLHAPATVSGSMNLYKGPNRINVVYYQGPYSQIALELRWSGPDTASQVVPASAFSYQK